MDDKIMIKLGPARVKRGEVWDEKGRSEIVQIFVSHSVSVKSLQFQYFENGALVLSNRHGKLNECDSFRVVRLNYPSEYLTCIRGWTSYDHVTSITFNTNLRIHGPFGQPAEYNEEFCFELGEDRQFGGFHGCTAGNDLTCIGVYIKPITSLNVNGELVKLENNTRKGVLLGSKSLVAR